MSLRLIPSTVKAACREVARLHRHHKPPAGGLFAVAVACTKRAEIVGVAIAGRPVARGLDDGVTVEVTRVATDGSRNACSMLYGAIRRAAVALGYARAVTYTLESEAGSSLKASGWKLDTTTRGGSWDCESRPRTDKHPTCPKLRWSVVL